MAELKLLPVAIANSIPFSFNFLKSLGFEKVHNIEGGFIDISFNEYHKDKGNLENSIVTNYNFN